MCDFHIEHNDHGNQMILRSLANSRDIAEVRWMGSPLVRIREGLNTTNTANARGGRQRWRAEEGVGRVAEEQRWPGFAVGVKSASGGWSIEVCRRGSTGGEMALMKTGHSFDDDGVADDDGDPELGRLTRGEDGDVSISFVAAVVCLNGGGGGRQLQISPMGSQGLEGICR